MATVYYHFSQGLDKAVADFLKNASFICTNNIWPHILVGNPISATYLGTWVMWFGSA